MSNDGGETWFTPNGINDGNVGAGYDVVIASNGTVHIVAGNKYYRSTDGDNFEDLTGNSIGDFPIITGRKVLAVSPEDPNYVYAVIVDSEDIIACLSQFLRSENGGTTWIPVVNGSSTAFDPTTNGLQCQGGYDLALAVDPANKTRVFIAGVTLWSWSLSTAFLQLDNTSNYPGNTHYVHADKHYITFDPKNPSTMYIASDGGISRSNNAGTIQPTFTTLNRNYNVTQFYSVAAGRDGRVMGGAQDNGTQYATLCANSFLSTTEVSGGDGGVSAISKIDPNIMFAALPEGLIMRSSNGGESFGVGFLDNALDCEPLNDADNSCGGDNQIDNADFITPYVLHENLATDNSVFPPTIIASESTARFVTCNNSGVILTTVNPLDPSTVPTWDTIGVFPSGSAATCMAVGKDTEGKQMVIAGSADGDIMVMRNIPEVINDAKTELWEEDVLLNVRTVEDGRTVTAIVIDPFDSKIVYIVLGNYGNSSYAYRISNIFNENAAFESMQGSGIDALPPMPIYDLVYDKTGFNRLFAATELGIFRLDIGFGYPSDTFTWTEENTGIGPVPVFDINQEMMSSPDCLLIYIGTHGKGIYRSTATAYEYCNTVLPNDCWTEVAETPRSTINTTDLISLNIAPNPVRSNATLQLNMPKNTSVNMWVFDVQGKQVMHQDLGRVQEGDNTLSIDVSNLSKGNYLVLVQDDITKHRVSKKMIVQ
jgi:hypothetical protein